MDVAYGGENGFSQAIDLASESLLNVRYVHERKLLSKLFEEIDKDTGKYCYGVRDVFSALAQGAIETLIIWEDLDLIRVTVKNSETGEIEYRHMTPAQRKANEQITTESGVVCEFQDEENLTEYFAEHYRDYGCKLEFVSDKSEEGSQFCKGFGGIGGILRYKVDFFDGVVAGQNDDEDDSEDSFI